jgi:hypothetical protein
MHCSSGRNRDNPMSMLWAKIGAGQRPQFAKLGVLVADRYILQEEPSKLRKALVHAGIMLRCWQQLLLVGDVA